MARSPCLASCRTTVVTRSHAHCHYALGVPHTWCKGGITVNVESLSVHSSGHVINTCTSLAASSDQVTLKSAEGTEGLQRRTDLGDASYSQGKA